MPQLFPPKPGDTRTPTGEATSQPPPLFPLHLLTTQFIANAAHLWQGPQSTTEDKKLYLASSLPIILYYFFFIFNMNALPQL